MKRILVSNNASVLVSAMRNGIGNYEAVKMQIANAQCNLAEMLNNGKDEESNIHVYVDEVVDVMGVLADYNTLIDRLSETSDHAWQRYALEYTECDEVNSKYDYAPSQKELATIEKIIKDEKVELSGVLKISEMSFEEIAESLCLSSEAMYKKVRTLIDSEIAKNHNGA